jgi:biopolymer transport protein ExbD
MKKGKRKLFGNKPKAKQNGYLSLQITSMADIFMILLVFLLKGIASDALAIAPSQGTRLPAGANTATLDQGTLQVELSQKGVLVEKDFIADFASFEKPLAERLSREREKEKFIASKNDSVKADGRAIVLSDQKVPFSTLKQVLRSLSENGYSEIKFGVIKE